MPKHTSNCPLCDVHYTTAEQFCLKCEYPFQGSKKEKKVFVVDLLDKLGRSPKAAWSRKYARFTLYIISAICLLQGFYLLMQDGTNNYGFPLLCGVLYTLLGLYTYKNPVNAVYFALTLLLGFYIFSILNQPEILIAAWPLYTLIFLGLSYAFYTVLWHVQPEP